MNRKLKLTLLSLLTLLLMAQPAAHCFSFKESLLQNFSSIKPYLTVANAFNATLFTTVAVGFGYALYLASKGNQNTFYPDFDGYKQKTKKHKAVKNNQLPEAKAELLRCLKEIHDITNLTIEEIDFVVNRIETVISVIKESQLIVVIECNRLFAAVKQYKKALNDEQEMDSENETERNKENIRRALLFAITNVESSCAIIEKSFFADNSGRSYYS